VQTPKPIPTSFAKELFFAISAFKFTNAAGVSRYGRYRILPVAGNEYLDDAGAAGKTPNFLFDELKERVEKEPVKFRIVVQLAQDGDTVDDATIRWPEDRPQLTFGEISLTAIAPDNASDSSVLSSIRFRGWMASRPRPTRCLSRERMSICCPADGAERPESSVTRQYCKDIVNQLMMIAASLQSRNSPQPAQTQPPRARRS
jgi:hypothetical protein